MTQMSIIDTMRQSYLAALAIRAYTIPFHSAKYFAKMPEDTRKIPFYTNGRCERHSLRAVSSGSFVAFITPLFPEGHSCVDPVTLWYPIDSRVTHSRIPLFNPDFKEIRDGVMIARGPLQIQATY